MSFQRPLPILCLGFLLMVVGCSGVPFGGQDDPVTLVVETSKSITQPHTFEVWVVERSATLTIRRSNGLNSTADLDAGIKSRRPAPGQTFTAVELPEAAMLHGRYTLEPGEKNRSSIDEYPPNFAVVVVIYQDDGEIVAWVSSICDGELVGLGVTMRYYGPDSAYTCRGGWG